MSIVLQFQTAPGKPVLRGIEHYWSVIRELDERDGGFTIHAVNERSDSFSKASVRDFIRRLVAAGMAEQIGKETISVGGETTVYRLIGPKPLRAPKLNRDGTKAQGGRGQEQMWNVLRGPGARGGISVRDLALRAATDDVPVTAQTAKSYVQALAAVGLLTSLKRGVWKLKPSADTGPRPPMILRSRIVYDPNREIAHAPIEAEEVSS